MTWLYLFLSFPTLIFVEEVLDIGGGRGHYLLLKPCDAKSPAENVFALIITLEQKRSHLPLILCAALNTDLFVLLLKIPLLQRSRAYCHSALILLVIV